MPVEKYQRYKADARAFPTEAHKNSQHLNTSELERPISEYDNIIAVPSHSQNFSPLTEISFRFDDSLSKTSSMSKTLNSTAASYNDEDKKPTTPHKHQYENVIETLQMRNKLESDQQVISNRNDEFSTPRSVMSDAKSSFFGLDCKPKPSSDDYSERPHYMNILSDDAMNEESAKVQIVLDKISATSSASGSSSTTATPSVSPTRHDDSLHPRKNSHGSNRSKSPKFMLPEPSPASPSPSQTVYMATTVPQNIKGQNIMGRHKPTRTSLRHSRMIVTSKYIEDTSNTNSLNIRHIWLAKFVLISKIIIGISLLTLGVWILLFANSTPIQQNPFYSGIIIIISGLLGLYLLSFRRTRSKLKANFFWFLKMNASVIIILSVFLTTLALIYAAFHYISLTSDNKKCFPENVFVNSSSCICVFNVPKSDLSTGKEVFEGKIDSSGHIDLPDGSNIVHFRDLSCNELSSWTLILLTSTILNLIGLILAVCFMTQFIFGCKRGKKRTYVPVKSSA